MLAQIAEAGAIITTDEMAADTIVVNTCGFLDAARQEALGVIRELAERKRRGTLRRIVVAGCLVQRDGRSLLDEIPEIDVLVGVHNRDDLAAAVCGQSRSSAQTGLSSVPTFPRSHVPTPARPHVPTSAGSLYLGDYHPQPWSDRGRLRLTPRHYAYVRISEGCNQKCTFCTIPAIRGPLHSKPPDEVVAECRELIADGAGELILIGQDTTAYGEDIGYAPGLGGLLRRLDAECDGARWLRLMYAYPRGFTDDAIAALAESPRFVKYVDLPLQHINDRVLKAMGRRVTRAETQRLLDQFRRRIPGVAIRTTFIVGFPGETEEEFAELLGFVRDFGFDAVGAFTYSHEPETPAGRMPEQLADATKRGRYERLMQVQQEVAFAAARGRIGTEFEVVVDGSDAAGRVVARHAGQAPDVDAVCLVGGAGPQPGARITVRCVGTDGYDLVSEPAVLPRGR